MDAVVAHRRLFVDRDAGKVQHMLRPIGGGARHGGLEQDEVLRTGIQRRRTRNRHPHGAGHRQIRLHNRPGRQGCAPRDAGDREQRRIVGEHQIDRLDPTSIADPDRYAGAGRREIHGLTGSAGEIRQTDDRCRRGGDSERGEIGIACTCRLIAVQHASTLIAQPGESALEGHGIGIGS